MATHDSATGQSSVFPVERSRPEEATVTIDITALETVSVLDAQRLDDDTDFFATTRCMSLAGFTCATTRAPSPTTES